MNIPVFPAIRNFRDAINYLLDKNVLDKLGIYYSNDLSTHHENNEKIFDELFFRQKFANTRKYSRENLNSSAFVHAKLKASISNFTHHERLKIFFELLERNLISQTYYNTQRRYGLQSWCKYSILNHLQGDLEKIDKLPLPSVIKNFLKEEDITVTKTQTNSPNP